MATKNVIAITNVDSLVGYALAHRFLEGNQAEIQKQETEVRLFCRQQQGLEKLVQLGGKIVEINYLEENQVCRALNDVQYLLFLPEFSHNRKEEGLNVLKAAHQQEVRYVAMISFVGVYESLDRDEWSNLKEYHFLEAKLAYYFDRGYYCVFRLPIVSQIFYYLAPIIEDQNTVRMPVNKDRKFSLVDLNDVIEAVYNLSTNEHKVSFSSRLARMIRSKDDHQNQNLFQFTPSHLCMTGTDMARKMAEGLGKERGLEYKKLEAQEMKEYLQGIRDDDRFKERPSANDKGENAHVFPIGRYLNDSMISTLLEWWDLADYDFGNTVTRDLEQALQRQPDDLREFFKNNRDNFRRLR